MHKKVGSKSCYEEPDFVLYAREAEHAQRAYRATQVCDGIGHPGGCVTILQRVFHSQASATLVKHRRATCMGCWSRCSRTGAAWPTTSMLWQPLMLRAASQTLPMSTCVGLLAYLFP